MPRKMKWVVRIVADIGELDTSNSKPENGVGHNLKEFIEQLRYAGLILIHRDNWQGMCFDLLPPPGVDTEMWAKLNAERMSSFGYNAVKAPDARS